MLGIRCPDRHALPHITPPKTRRPRYALPPARAGSFYGAGLPLGQVSADGSRCPIPAIRDTLRERLSWNPQPLPSLGGGNRS